MFGISNQKEVEQKEYSFNAKDYAKIIFESDLRKIDKYKLNHWQKFLHFLDGITKYSHKKAIFVTLFLIIIGFIAIKLMEIENCILAFVFFVLFFFVSSVIISFIVDGLIPNGIEYEEDNILPLKIIKNQKDILKDLNANDNLTNYEKDDMKSYLKEYRYEKDYGYQKLIERENILKIKEKIEQEKEIADIFK